MLRVDVVVFCEVDNSWAHALLKSAGKLDPSLQRQTRCVSWHETCSHFLSSRGFVVECKCLSFLQASEWVTWNTLPQLLFFMRHTARISSDTSSYSTQTQRVFILSLSWHRHIHVRLIRCSRISKRKSTVTSVFSQMNPVDVCHFNIFPSSMPTYPKWSVSFRTSGITLRTTFIYPIQSTCPANPRCYITPFLWGLKIRPHNFLL